MWTGVRPGPFSSGRKFWRVLRGEGRGGLGRDAWRRVWLGTGAERRLAEWVRQARVCAGSWWVEVQGLRAVLSTAPAPGLECCVRGERTSGVIVVDPLR